MRKGVILFVGGSIIVVALMMRCGGKGVPQISPDNRKEIIPAQTCEPTVRLLDASFDIKTPNCVPSGNPACTPNQPPNTPPDLPPVGTCITPFFPIQMKLTKTNILIWTSFF